jgi:hypothetical protein
MYRFAPRFAYFILVPKAQIPRIFVDVTLFGEAVESARAQRLE